MQYFFRGALILLPFMEAGQDIPGRLYVARLLSLLPLPAAQQLMLQLLWLEQELGHVSASQGWVADSPMFNNPGLLKKKKEERDEKG